MLLTVGALPCTVCSAAHSMASSVQLHPCEKMWHCIWIESSCRLHFTFQKPSRLEPGHSMPNTYNILSVFKNRLIHQK
ncbi:hypothetical protein BX661DRAFT_100941 [Kickxella alabastrina]|uniref:uncharacterized protein n=1 Tax=Kickxella alabastrina TaxID=61397 RepID=UPI00221FDEFA|nr:uncharacterized protein BX661DRAFT_100941 [Kickxella alabastrina]KAI7829182.1 hypothetical protein BX661DRAFT_100941 [Kickxella alabastrina]